MKRCKHLIAFFIILILQVAGIPEARCEDAKLARDDEAFLDSIEHQAFDYFLQESNPANGLVYDGSTHAMGASIAATGFGLSALCVGDSRGWISHNDAYKRVLATLKTFQRDRMDPEDFYADGRFGLFFHFLDINAGKWYKNADCVSTADTADLIAGIITCMEYFKGTEVERVGDAIVRAVEWDKFMFDNNEREHRFIAMGYIPPDENSTWNREKGYFGRYYGYRDNSFLIYLLGIASPEHAIYASSWYACQSTYWRQTYNGKTVIVTAPPGLAFHYYPHCWLDLRNKKDQVADYFRNSMLAVEAQQEYCGQSDNYTDGIWGISSSLSLRGYETLGAPFDGVYDNGTITPHAIAGGLVFTPDAALETLKRLVADYDGAIMGKYGLTDALNPSKEWTSREYIGIDQGLMVLGIENFRSGLIWRYFTRNSYIRDALRKIGFVGVIEDFEADASGLRYSTYEVVNKNATAVLTSEVAMDGAQSIRISSKDPGDIIFTIKPELKYFSQFKYLSLWARNTKSINIDITDKKDDTATYAPCASLESAGWQRYFYDITRTDGVDFSNIRHAALTIERPGDRARDAVYLDGIFLTYDKVDANPPSVRDLDVSAVKDYAICKVSFEKAPAAHRYDIRMSTKPIRGQADFEKLTQPGSIFFASGRATEEYFVPVPNLEKYYVGVQAVDYMGQRSDVVSVGPVTVDSAASQMMLDDFEHMRSPFQPVEWPTYRGYNLTVAKECASQGKCSLKIEYNKSRGSEWTYVEMSFKRPIDIRPFKYLKMDVQGDDNILVKLYNTKQMQEEVATLSPLRKGEWNELAFDISSVPEERVDKTQINKILFFIAPGRVASGTMYFDNIRFDNVEPADLVRRPRI